MSTFFRLISPARARCKGLPGPRLLVENAGMRSCSSRYHAAWLVAVALASAVAVPLPAAKAPKETKESKASSGPVLMSRTGGAGGDSWASIKELEQAAAKGNPKAEAYLGEILLRGDGIAKDEVRGVALLEKAARAGNPSAAFRIGMLLANGESGVAKDPPRALAYFRAAAAGGEKEAFFNIGAAYGSARGVKRDYGEALGWLIVAKQRGADASAESALRSRIQNQPMWIARGERRAREIEQEFAGKKVADLLPPPAPLDFPAEPAIEPKPAESLKPPSTDLKPGGSLRPPELLKPDLPPLPMPSVKP